jgi:predicted nucleic acid-binding protein
MSSFLFDTCFLIDLEREMKRGAGKAHEFLQRNLSARPCISLTIAGEFAEGFGDIQHPTCAAMLNRFDILPMDETTAHHYATITRYLRSQSQLIGTNDLWIAAASLAHGIPLVTNNATHFNRVPGLTVIGY